MMNDDDSLITPKAMDGSNRPAMTPGLTIGTATPYLNGISNTAAVQNQRPTTAEEGTALEKQTSQHSQTRGSMDRLNDYFSSNALPRSPVDGQAKGPATPGDTSLEATALSPIDADKEDKSKESNSLFGKKFRMTFPKKLGRSSTDVKPLVVDEKSEESDKSEEKEDKPIQDNFFGTIQKIRYDYEERLQNAPSQHLPPGVTPSLLSETPLLRLPPFTTVIIQEERPDSGGVADLYRGTVSSVGHDADLIEKFGPMWLGELLVKVVFLISCHQVQNTDRIRIKCPRKTFQRFPLCCYLTKIFYPVSQVPMGRSYTLTLTLVGNIHPLAGTPDSTQIECYEQRKY